MLRKGAAHHGRQFFGVPAHMFRQAVRDSMYWVSYVLHGNWDAAFRHEHSLRFFVGFVQTSVFERQRSQ